jgi:hypothetical protein
MKKDVNIEDVLVPDRNKLKVKKGVITTTIVDCELDPYECTFNNGGDVEINTKGYTHITLDINDLENLILLIMDAEEMYFKLNSKK